jgi:hypothetical protein
MPTWKQINEAGGTLILRVVSGLIAFGALYCGFVIVVIRGDASVSKLGTVATCLLLFGSYAVLGNGANRLFNRDRSR